MEEAAFAYDPSEWTDLFVAAAGAAAALAGLVFVAVSINIERILKLEGMPERGLVTVLLLLEVLVISLIGLIPGQGPVALGAEFLGASLIFAAVIAKQSWASAAAPDEVSRVKAVARHVIVAAGTVPLVVGGVTVLAEAGGGLYWIAGGIVVAFVGAVSNAWVLLVEILR